MELQWCSPKVSASPTCTALQNATSDKVGWASCVYCRREHPCPKATVAKTRRPGKVSDSWLGPSFFLPWKYKQGTSSLSLLKLGTHELGCRTAMAPPCASQEKGGSDLQDEATRDHLSPESKPTAARLHDLSYEAQLYCLHLDSKRYPRASW